MIKIIKNAQFSKQAQGYQGSNANITCFFPISFEDSILLDLFSRNTSQDFAIKY